MGFLDRLRGIPDDVARPEIAVRVSASADAEIDRLIEAGQKIQAIKVYRDAHGTGLRESKDAVEARWDHLHR